jgi:hypothetical protein
MVHFGLHGAGGALSLPPAQLGREGRTTLRVGFSRHWQPYGHGCCGQAQVSGRGLALGMARRSLFVRVAAFAPVAALASELPATGRIGGGLSSGLAASAVTTAAPMANARKATASLDPDM